MKIVINTDAHSAGQLHFIKYGIDQARRGWLEERHVLNTMPRPQLETWLNSAGRDSTGQSRSNLWPYMKSPGPIRY